MILKWSSKVFIASSPFFPTKISSTFLDLVLVFARPSLPGRTGLFNCFSSLTILDCLVFELTFSQPTKESLFYLCCLFLSGVILRGKYVYHVFVVIIRRLYRHYMAKPCFKKMNGISTVHSFSGGTYIGPFSSLRCCDWLISRAGEKIPSHNLRLSLYNHSIKALAIDWKSNVFTCFCRILLLHSIRNFRF